MPPFSFLALFLVWSWAAPAAPAAIPESPGETVIHRWQGDALAAVSVTMDDGYANQRRYMAPMLTARGFRGTFYVVPGWLDSEDLWSSWRKVSEAGHVIDSHTLNHVSLVNLDPEQLTTELRNSRNQIRRHLGVDHGRTLAYPYSHASPEVEAAVAEAGYEAARAGGDQTNPETPEDFYLVHSHHPLSGTDLKQMTGWVDEAIEEEGWLVLGVHGIFDPDQRYPETQEGWEAVPVARYEGFLDDLLSRGPALWVAPFDEVARYIKSRDAASARLLECNTGRIRVELDGSPGSDLVSLETVVPDSWTGVRLELSTGRTRTYSTRLRGGRRVVWYEAAPPNSITLRPSGVSQDTVLTRSRPAAPERSR